MEIRGPVRGMIRKTIYNRSDWDDVYQSFLLSVWADRFAYRPAGYNDPIRNANAQAYLTTILQNVCRMRYRKQKTAKDVWKAIEADLAETSLGTPPGLKRIIANHKLTHWSE